MAFRPCKAAVSMATVKQLSSSVWIMLAVAHAAACPGQASVLGKNCGYALQMAVWIARICARNRTAGGASLAGGTGLRK
eukprot:2919681-Karenia_brevis.AAC.1